ncbi:MAG: STAS domain-containing protein [Succinivibrio sp.]
MDVSCKENSRYSLITITGRVDATNAPDLDTQLEELLVQEKRAVLVDLSGVEYMSSAGLRSILKLAKHCQANNMFLGCYSLQPNVSEVFRISGFSTIIKLFDNLESAEKAI